MPLVGFTFDSVSVVGVGVLAGELASDPLAELESGEEISLFVPVEVSSVEFTNCNAFSIDIMPTISSSSSVSTKLITSPLLSILISTSS